MTTLGSAELLVDGGVGVDVLSKGKHIILGKSTKDPNLYHAVEPKQHLVSVAPTRSGKGAGLVIPNLLNYCGSAIVIDPKGENAWVTAECRRRDLGQKTIIIDPWDEVNFRYGKKSGNLEKSDTFNPLSILNPKSVHYSDDLAYIANSLIFYESRENPHWANSARELVAGLISYVIEKSGEKKTLTRVRELLSKPSDEFLEIAKDSQLFGEASLARRKLGRFTQVNKENNGIISTALTQTSFLDSEKLGSNLSKSSFKFEDLLESPATIYLVLPIDKLETYGRWLRLMISIGIRTVARNSTKLPAPVLFILDEFGTIGHLPAIAQAYGLMAASQMRLWIILQNLVQLVRDYADDWQTFIGNSQVITFFNVMDQFTAEYFSKMLGETTVDKKSGKARQFRLDALNYNGDLVERDLLQPSEVRRLESSKGILITCKDPIIFKKINYYDDQFFYEKARIDPNFPSPQEIAEVKKSELNEAIIQRDFNACAFFLKEQGYYVKIHDKDETGSTYVGVIGYDINENMHEFIFFQFVRDLINK